MQYTYDNFNIKKNFVFWSGQLARDARPTEPTNLKSVGLPYLDNQLQQVASLLQESQCTLLFYQVCLWARGCGLHRDHEPGTIAI